MVSGYVHEGMLVLKANKCVPLYGKLEHRVLLLIDWRLSKLLLLERLLIFHEECIGMHTAIYSHTDPLCSSETAQEIL